jgi:glycosyltransferase involved in cell wall biosynthesis
VVLLCPCHYLFDEVAEGSEFAWAYYIGDRVARRLPGSVVVTGAARLTSPKPYPIVELRPHFDRNAFFNLGKAIAFNTTYSLATMRLIRRRHFDIVHHVLPFAISTTYNLSWSIGVPHVRPKFVLGPVQAPLDTTDADLMGAWDGRLIDRGKRLVSPMLRGLSRQTIQRADRIVAINRAATRVLVGAGADPEKIRTIPPGIDTNRFRPRSRPARTAVCELLVAGYLLQRKAIDVVLLAVAELISAGRRVHLTVVGDGPQRAPLESMAAGLSLSSHVKFVGSVKNSQMPERYQEADIFVSMSTAESFSAVCLEAMASGLPVVASPVGVFADVVRPGANGYLIASGNSHELAVTIGRLIDDRPRRTFLGENARKDVVAQFDWDAVIMPQYFGVYSELFD